MADAAPAPVAQTSEPVITPIAKFVAMLMHARTSVHIMHLQTRSFAQHMALDELYKGIPDLVDDLVEACQGLYGIIETYPAGWTPPSRDALAEVVAMAKLIKATRRQLPQESELQNIIDEIAALFDTAIYKLRFLA